MLHSKPFNEFEIVINRLITYSQELETSVIEFRRIITNYVMGYPPNNQTIALIKDSPLNQCNPNYKNNKLLLIKNHNDISHLYFSIIKNLNLKNKLKMTVTRYKPGLYNVHIADIKFMSINQFIEITTKWLNQNILNQLKSI